MVSSQTAGLPHWAACRKPDFKYAGVSVWRSPHDRERLLLDYWFQTGGPLVGRCFDVRRLPGYSPYPAPFPSTLQAVPPWQHGQLGHHAAIICRCMDDGIDLTSL